MSPKNSSEIGRFFRHVELGHDDHWLWVGASKPGAGYGFFHYAGRQGKAHRFAHEIWKGPIPAGMQIDHLCRIPACVNPDHLEAVTPRENVLRSRSFVAENARKSGCPRGHAYSGKNIQGRRICHTCARDWMRKHREARRAA